MTLFLFAQTAEARDTIDALGAVADPTSMKEIWSEGYVPTHYRSSYGTIIITDIGMFAAAAALAKYAPLHNRVVNIGFAGALHDDLTLFDLVGITSVNKYVPDVTQSATSQQWLSHSLPAISCALTGRSLVSSDLPIHCKEKRYQLHSAGFDVVDMEGYAIAHLAKELQLPCSVYKIVSDFASPGGRSLIKQHRHTLSKKIADFILNTL